MLYLKFELWLNIGGMETTCKFSFVFFWIGIAAKLFTFALVFVPMLPKDVSHALRLSHSTLRYCELVNKSNRKSSKKNEQQQRQKQFPANLFVVDQVWHVFRYGSFSVAKDTAIDENSELIPPSPMN